MAKKHSSSKRWLREHDSDVYVKQAQAQGFRSRAVFKLQEIQERDSLFNPGARVLDLGAAPGSWSQYAATQVGARGHVIALDILPMESLPGVVLMQGDIRDEAVFQDLLTRLEYAKVDVVLSDMAPNMSGTRLVDQLRSMELAELALDIATRVLASDGIFLVKLFQGAGFEQFRKLTQQAFTKVQMRKPPASRARSRESYLLARGFKMTDGRPIL